jgi:hypothetical protein
VFYSTLLLLESFASHQKLLHSPKAFCSISNNIRSIYRFNSHNTLFFPGYSLHPFTFYIPDLQNAASFISFLQQHSIFPTPRQHSLTVR